jgi:cyanophycinase-like exopeptidase
MNISKTKFILHGGYTREQNEHNEGFFKELASSVPDKGTILLVYFANDGDFDKKFEEDKIRISSFAENKEINFVRATENDFIAQVKNADLIYLRGGDTQKLKNQLSTYPELRESISEKTIAGSSAGAYVLAKYYYSNSRSNVFEGFGFLPVRVICHYQSKIHPMPANTDPVAVINKFDNSMELVLLRDYEWKVFVV